MAWRAFTGAQWEERGVLLALRRAFLNELNDRQKLRWNECFIDGSSPQRKKGRQNRPHQAR